MYVVIQVKLTGDGLLAQFPLGLCQICLEKSPVTKIACPGYHDQISMTRKVMWGCTFIRYMIAVYTKLTLGLCQSLLWNPHWFGDNSMSRERRTMSLLEHVGCTIMGYVIALDTKFLLGICQILLGNHLLQTSACPEQSTNRSLWGYHVCACRGGVLKPETWKHSFLLGNHHLQTSACPEQSTNRSLWGCHVCV